MARNLELSALTRHLRQAGVWPRGGPFPRRVLDARQGKRNEFVLPDRNAHPLYEISSQSPELNLSLEVIFPDP